MRNLVLIALFEVIGILLRFYTLLVLTYDFFNLFKIENYINLSINLFF